MKQKTIFDIINSPLTEKRKLNAIELLQWSRLSIKLSDTKKNKKIFEDLVEKEIHKLNPFIEYAKNSEQIAKLTLMFIQELSPKNKNLLIVAESKEKNKNYFPIFLHN